MKKSNYVNGLDIGNGPESENEAAVNSFDRSEGDQHALNSPPLSSVWRPASDDPILPSLLSAHLSDTFAASDLDLVCFSHLRWDFVYQRPQHLLTRVGLKRRVFFIEEPVFDHGSMRLEVSERGAGIHVCTPHLPQGLLSSVATEAVERAMIDRLFAERGIRQFVAWYYTPMALRFSRHLSPLATVYDCMDELSLFKNAPPALREREGELLSRADVVFTGGQSLYEAKRAQHANMHPFPSSIDRAHFAQAREPINEPEDQQAIAHPRFGFFGVIDERFDIELLAQIAAMRPTWQFVMIGPVVKINVESLPRRANIHYLGAKSYEELPAYLAGWEAALLLFARNDATRFISPTKTPEYLAAGKPVISTSIRDVVRPYGEQGLVHIADAPEEFVRAAETALAATAEERVAWLRRVDDFLAHNSWDETWERMSGFIDEAIWQRRREMFVAPKAARVSAAAASTARANN